MSDLFRIPRAGRVVESYDEDDDDQNVDFGTGCWVLPNGSVEYTDYENDIHHGDLAMDHFGSPKDGDEPNDGPLAAGWVRVRWHEGGMFIVEVTPGAKVTNSSLRVVKQLANGSGSIRFVVEVPGTYKEADSPNTLMGMIRRVLDTPIKKAWFG